MAKKKGKARKSEEVVKLKPILIKGGLHKKRPEKSKVDEFFKTIFDSSKKGNVEKVSKILLSDDGEKKEKDSPLMFVSIKPGDTIKEEPLRYAALGNGGVAPVINGYKTPLEENVALAKRYIQAGYQWNIMDECDRLCFRVTMFKAVGEEVRGAVILFGYRDYIWWGGGVDGLNKKLKEVEQWFVSLRSGGYDVPKPEEVLYQ